MVSAQLKTGAAGRSAVRLVAKGPYLYVPPPISATEFFAQDSRVIVQLINDETGLCWSSEFPTAIRNDGAAFKAATP